MEANELSEQGLQALRVIRHNFKTPLTSLKMLGQIFQLGVERGTLGDQPERTQRNCRMLVDQVDKLVMLADHLYEISLAQTGRLQLTRQLADLRPVLHALAARAGSAPLTLSLSEEPLWGQWDTAKIEQALAALLAEGSGLTLEAVRDTPGEWVTLKISGTFDELSEKLAPARYLARVIIELHGGTLEGRFVVRLPLTCQK